MPKTPFLYQFSPQNTKFRPKNTIFISNLGPKTPFLYQISPQKPDFRPKKHPFYIKKPPNTHAMIISTAIKVRFTMKICFFERSISAKFSRQALKKRFAIDFSPLQAAEKTASGASRSKNAASVGTCGGVGSGSGRVAVGPVERGGQCGSNGTG
jgi:hypothetical protein